MESARRGASGMDAARELGAPAINGHGWPFTPAPRSADDMREVERSETRMQGQDLLVPLGGAGHPGDCQKGLAQQGETKLSAHSPISLTLNLSSAAFESILKNPEPIQPPPHSSNRHIHLFPCPHALARLATETR
ncbi:hypothetical protein A9A72_122511 [Stutzerimonas stutzeri]|jgi:hypothetical protein|uniref:Uncharacterized protein n=1 Tax=Stutzerimonas stutzeri TaxID=316 RepID=A0A5S5BI59_STUST|nr:hypothetical protein A9A72_122511 [Stutzerimonas stutzeri]